jgi:hypothetical protein
LAVLIEQVAESGEAIEQHEVVVGVAGDAGNLGNATGGILLQPHTAQCVGKNFDSDAVSAAHHDE